MSNWLERYHGGERLQVWAEMTALGAGVRDDSASLEATEVVRETMRRARHNVEQLLEFLSSIGYEFESYEGGEAFVPPPVDVVAQLDALEQKIGRLPLSLRLWFEEVGQVNFMGSHPDWEFYFADPLVVEAPVDYVLSDFDEWEKERGTEWDRGPYVIELAPDFKHKADVSGGAPYAMRVPDEAADGLFLEERHQTTFVSYLRLSFQWGGFPGWDGDAEADWANPPCPLPENLAKFAATLLPI